jgi:hypothetical protein
MGIPVAEWEVVEITCFERAGTDGVRGGGIRDTISLEDVILFQKTGPPRRRGPANAPA